MYMGNVDAVFCPYAKAWRDFFESRCPDTASAVSRLPQGDRALYYLLYGFIATKGQGP